MVIISNDVRALPGRGANDAVTVVATPLDLIVRLEADPEAETVVILDGSYAGCAELARVLMDIYPHVRVVDGDPETSPEVVEREACGPSPIA